MKKRGKKQEHTEIKSSRIIGNIQDTQRDVSLQYAKGQQHLWQIYTPKI